MSRAKQSLDALMARTNVQPSRVHQLDVTIFDIDESIELEVIYQRGNPNPDSAILRHETGDSLELSGGEATKLLSIINGVS